MPDALADRRGAPRYALIVVAEVIEQATGTRLSARTSDVSLTGCYVDTLNPMKSGTNVRLILTRVGEAFETLARVVYVSPGLGMGLCFDEPISSSQLPILERWLKSEALLAR
jgi:hypothetical protein